VCVDRADEFTFELERNVPQEAQQQGAHVVVFEHQLPQRSGELRIQLILLEFPGDCVDTLGDECLLKKLRIIDQAFLQQRDLFLEQLDGLGVLQLRNLFPGILDMVPVALDLQAGLVVTFHIDMLIAAFATAITLLCLG
jgi:hypothetical protein